jgi:hypothetical protein
MLIRLLRLIATNPLRNTPMKLWHERCFSIFFDGMAFSRLSPLLPGLAFPSSDVLRALRKMKLSH